MVRMMRKNVLWVVSTILIYVFCFVVFFKTEDSSVRFLVCDESGNREISLYAGQDGVYYVFLPSYATMEDVSIAIPSGKEITLGGSKLIDGMHAGQYEIGVDYELKENNRKKGILRFCQSANVATMYINTATGTMKHIHADKNNEEKASMVLIRPDGTVEHQDVLSTLKGRGNTTWGYHKKPYCLQLSGEANLLGLGISTEWVLLANAADGSNINNKLIYDLAKQTGLPWTPQCEYVDVYLNGEYSGLYLLSEKVDVGNLEDDSNSDSFLCEFRKPENNQDFSYCISTSQGRTALIMEPRKIDNERKAQIEALVEKMERELLSGSDLTQSPLIDLDSWVRKYILDEIASNVDSDRASCFFFYADGKFYAGPIWDYDKGFGNCMQSRNPQSFVANNEKRSASYSLPYYPILYKNPSFQKRVCEIYQAEFLPLLEELANSRIEEMAQRLSASIKMDQLRWMGLTPELQSSALIATNPQTVKYYLKQKIAFLNSAWIEGVDYCTVQFQLADGAEYVNYAVKRGDIFTSSDIDTQNTIWVTSDTGEVFDFSQPITQDVMFHIQQGQSEQGAPVQASGGGRSTLEYLTVASVFMVVFLIICLLAVDRHHRRQERRNVHDS
ncbi:MAG: hypothetical protein E7466_03855 [Ruminococcaceae bacterium]|nr:hypothetical protein [Oscillospiraceae bacterium]